jgi:hypothetical protein
MLKNPTSIKEILHRQNSAFLRHVPPASLIDGSEGRVARELWWTNQEISSSLSFHHGSPCSYITWEINNGLVGGHS